MHNPVVVYQSQAAITLYFDLARYPIYVFQLFVDEHFAGAYSPTAMCHFPSALVSPSSKQLKVCCMLTSGQFITHSFLLNPRSPASRSPESRQFLPGDILVASDNVNGLPPGYMGHSAIIVDENHIIESISEPAIRKKPINGFLTNHPRHAHYRPVDSQIGKKAKEYAEQYLRKYLENLQKGKHQPKFAFKPEDPLDDPWSTIYCSKLIWLSYAKGAKIELENDFYLFSPEDLATTLSKDKRFELVYKHPDFGFNLNT
jgi:hypothetical protein